MPTLKDFIDALQAGWFVALTVFVGSSILLAGDFWQLPYLNDIPAWLLIAATVAGVFSFSVLLVNVTYIPVKLWDWVRRRQERQELKQTISNVIQQAPPEELAVLAYLVQSGRQAFNAKLNDRRLSPLVSKGILLILPGTHSVLEWPYMVHPEAWEILIEHKGELQIAMPPEGHDPFHWNTW